MKKMKRAVAMVEPSSYAAAYEEQRTRFKHHNLIKDYQELHQNAEAMKERLQMMKQKRSTLMAEVRFLRRRYKYLLGNQSMNPQPKHDVMQRHNSETQRTTILKKKSSNKKESALPFPLPALDLNHKERISHGMGEPLNKFAPKFDLNHKARALSTKNAKETALHNRPPKFDLNHKARALSGKEAAMQNPIPKFDLNQKERIQSGNESAKRKNTPVFDLNEISREEEEFQANREPLRIDEPNKSILVKGENDEQHNDMKLLVCRNSGNGSNRSGKRKITWQDQVALRV